MLERPLSVMKLSGPPDEARTFEMIRTVKSGKLTPPQTLQLARAKTDTAGKRASILVVDDSDSLREVLVLTLRDLGYENISEARDGQAALDLLQEKEFDLIVLDIEMPRLDGYAVLAKLKSDPFRRHLPVIVASGLDQLEAVVRCIELGAEDFLPKPVHPVLLRARVTASLERKRLRDLERLRLMEAQLEKELLEFEKEKSERLLLNILPLAIAERLKQGDHTIAERFASVTVLFADLIGFTSFANRTDPEKLVALLNDLFSRFDQIAERHGLEKIKTIGDSYMVVGGMPELRPNHVEAVAEMALEMLTALTDLNREHGTEFALRIGLNAGPVIAGVIGRKKFTYDLWGAAVNLASRMQSSGLPNRVHLPADTAEMLKDKFILTERGEVDCKGLGLVRTYILEGKRVAGDTGIPSSGSAPKH
ncbi:MAG: cya [Verrucomicrobia bacterium]|nr:cya [Verrucomicrobiota bacterium]